MAGTSTTTGFFAKAHYAASRAGSDSGVPVPAVIEAGDSHLHLAIRSVTARGRELDLTPAEFDVLVSLAGHPKSIVTPHTMPATNSAGSVRQVEFLRALTSLAKKLDAETGAVQHYIKTEP